MIQRVFLCLCLAAAVSLPVHAVAEASGLRALAGERLEFAVRWGILPAARAVLEVIPQGPDRLVLRSSSRTLPWLDAFYPVQDEIESVVETAEPRVVSFRRRSRTGWRESVEEQIRFESGTAFYSRDGVLRGTRPVPHGVQDPLSSLFAYRALPSPFEGEARFDVTDGIVLIAGTVTAGERETVETPVGTFETVRVEPRLEGIRGVFPRRPGARIVLWLTDDRWHRPVRLESEVVVGSFVAELIRVVAPAPSPPDPR